MLVAPVGLLRSKELIVHVLETHEKANEKSAKQQYQQSVSAAYYATVNGHLRHIFSNMRQRCENPAHRGYNRYGGRGIKCLFASAEELIDYVVNTLKVDPRGLDCDRTDNDGHYEPGNIRFITHKENCNNRGVKG